ncbi:hypothetical protein MP638_006246, partial [Amoeboaphelidium occidentale]
MDLSLLVYAAEIAYKNEESLSSRAESPLIPSLSQ